VDEGHKIISLGTQSAAAKADPAPSRPGGMHALGISGMAVCALVGISSMLAFISVHWPGETGRFVIAVLVGSTIGFLAFASVAVLAAARDTYARPDSRRTHSDDLP
jgi:hypothetical protein